MDRLTREIISEVLPEQSSPAGTITYDGAPGYADTAGFDKVGNRYSRTVSLDLPPVSPFDTASYGYNQNDWLASDSYDANGNTLLGSVSPAQTANDEYDFENRLITRHSTDNTIAITYDGDGSRVRKAILSPDGNTLIKTIYYIVDDKNPTGYAQVLEEWVENSFSQPIGSEFRAYTYGHDLISQRWPGVYTSANLQFYGYDGHGSVRFLTDVNGNITDTYTYDAFGTLIARTPASQPTPNNYLYAGEQWDPHLGLYYNRARYDNPNTGRFWTRDLFEGSQGDPFSLHKYLYAHANPVNGVDPSGALMEDLLYRVSAMVSMAAYYLGPVIQYGRIAAATATLIGFVAGSEDFRAEVVSAAGGPGAAMEILTAEISFLSRSGTAEANSIAAGVSKTIKRNRITIKYNGGNVQDFKVKTSRLQRAAQDGDLTVVSNPQRLRDRSAQEKYREAVFKRYVRRLQQLGMNESEANAFAKRKFDQLHVDHKLDLQVSGALSDPNSFGNMQMLDSQVNTSVGRQLQKGIEDLELTTGDSIDEIIVVGPQ